MTVRDADTLKSYFTLSKVPVPSQYNDLIDTIFSMSGGGGGGGLHDDRYVKLSLQDTITAIHTFNPTTADAPFILGTNAKNKTVIGFRADQLAKSVIAGNGLTGGGLLTADVSLYVGQGDGITVAADTVSLTTPGTLSVSSSNNASGNHTHAITTSSNPSDSQILSSDSNGYLRLPRLYTDNIKNKIASGSLTIDPEGSIYLDPGGDNVLPVTNYLTNLGSINKKYLTLHAAELWVETLVAAEVIATVGGHILVAPTTSLTSDVDSVQTQLCLNPSFETAGGGGADVFANWVEYAGTGSIVRDSTYKQQGVYSCRLTAGTSFDTNITQQFDVNEGEGFTFSFYSRNSNGSYRGRYGVYDNDNTSWIIPLTACGGTTVFSQLTVTFSVPTGSKLITIYFYCPGSGSGSYTNFDYVLLYKDVIYTKHNNLARDDIIYLNSSAKIEFMKIIESTFSNVTPYTYYVQRNLDGTGTNTWFAGDAVLNTGNNGDGYIDLYADHSIKGDTEYGPTIAGVIRTGTGYSDLTEGWAVGNLNGLYGYGIDTYGAAFGRYQLGYNYITIEPTNGIQMKSNRSIVGERSHFKLNLQGDMFIGMDITAVAQTHFAYFNVSQTYNSESFGQGDLLLGSNSSAKANLLWDYSEGSLNIRVATTKRIELTSTGIMYIRDSAGTAVFTFDASSGAEITKKLTMPGTSSALAIGATPPTSASSGTGIWIDRTGLYNLVSSVQNFKIDATSGALYIGAYDISQYPIKADAQGFLFKTYGAGDNYQSHIEFGADHSSGLKGQIYYYYSGAGVFNILQIVANPSSNTGGSLYMHGYDILLEGGTGGVTLTAGTGGFKCGPGITIGDDTTAPPTATIQILDKNSNPSYYSAGEQVYGYGGALMHQNVNNRRFNLTGGGGCLAFLVPLTFPQPRAVWLTQTGSDYDHTRYHTPLTPNSMANSTYKSPITPGPAYICDFNGTSSYLSADLTTYAHLNLVNWMSFGAWIYIDATGRNHAVGAMGSTTNAWYLIWYNAGAYWEFGYVDTGGTTRRVQRTATLTAGWHFVGFEHGWSASGNNHTLVRYDNTTTALDNQAWLGMRSGAGYLTLGNYGSYLLDGKMATAWLAGYMPASVGDNLAEYYNLTVGLFR